jgi:DNA repair exonuclease SbcCD ATPase subunit
LKAVTIYPNNHVNRISGANGSGKTSILDSIEWVLQGTSTVPSQPVRKGAGRARIIAETEEYIITRTFSEGGSKNGILKLESKASPGTFSAGPQDLLNKILGKISFDPLEFLRMKPEKQLEHLRQLVKFDIDLDQLDKDYEADYLLRRDLKKEVTALETRRDAIHVPEGLPAKKTDEAALVKELREASEYNAEIERNTRERAETVAYQGKLKSTIETLRDEATELRRRADNMEAEANEQENIYRKAEEHIAAWHTLPEPKNAGDLADAITAAKRINSAIDQRNFRATFEREIEQKEKKIEELSAALKRREAEKTEALSNASYPVAGLAFGNDEVIYEGLPFNQVSNADQIRAAVGIGMATNPQLKVMRIKDGSLLDDASMDIIKRMAQEHDSQVFIEVVDTTGKVGVYLEDGEVKAVNEEPEPDEQPEPAKPPRKTRAKKIAASA